jgi:hypothetical protein
MSLSILIPVQKSRVNHSIVLLPIEKSLMNTEWFDDIQKHPGFENFLGKEVGYKRHLMVQYQGELFVYQSQVRCINLREWKRSKENKKPATYRVS